MADAMTAAALADVPAYRGLPPAALEACRAGLAHVIGIFLAMAGTPAPAGLPSKEGRWLRDLGAEQARQGFPLEVVLQGLQVSMQVGWRQLTATLDSFADGPQRVEVMAELPVLLVRFIAHVEAALVAGHTEGLANQERDRTDLLNDLFAGSFDSDEEFLARAATCGLNVAGEQGLILLTSGGGAAEVTRAGRAVRVALTGALATTLSAGQAPHLAVLVPYSSETTAGSARAILGGIAAEHSVTALIVGCVNGPSAAHRAYRQAIPLTALALAVSPYGGVVQAEDLVTDRCLHAVPEVLLRDLLDRTLGPVLQLSRRRNNAMIDTLWALHHHGSQTAARRRSACTCTPSGTSAPASAT